MRWVTRVAVVVILIAAVIGGLCVYRGVSVSLHAEHVLHAALLTVELIDEHVRLHNGQWPRSWTDLEELPARERGMFKWPDDSPEVQKYVTVDFSADPRQIAKQTIEEFDAVRPIGPYYPFKDYGSVEALINTVRAHSPKE